MKTIAGPNAQRCTLERPTPVAVLASTAPAAIDPLQRPAAGIPDRLDATVHGIIGRSPKLQAVLAQIQKIARSDANVCIHGESGTGKELLARAIHAHSPRSRSPFVTVDCTAIPEGLVESHLFGHVRGAYTGAVEGRQGVFALARAGSVFLDELCELSPPLQAKFLRVIQHREFVPVGGSRTVRCDVRLITATNRDPAREVEQGRFREDLYYRIAVVVLHIPPLRERREDIPLLADHFLHTFAHRHGKRVLGLHPEAMARLVEAPWPGNIRQLQNVIECAVILARGDTLTVADLSRDDLAAGGVASNATLDYEPGLPLHEVERRHILDTLRSVDGHRREAARRLGISVRCLQYKLKDYAFAHSGPSPKRHDPVIMP